MINFDITTFAETTFRNQKLKFGIKTDDRRRHMYLIGKTGMGKSTILENMIVADIRAGRGVAVVDPHGDLAEKIMQYIPAERIKDIIYFNPSDTDFPIAFNIVEQVDAKVRHLVASGLIGVFKKLWADSWGPRLEYILRNAILAVLDYPDSTLLSVIRMLSDKNYRKKVIDEVHDPVVKAFWVKEFAGYADKFASEAVSPIQNKVGQFLSSSLIRNIIGQTKSSIDVRAAMDSGKILIMNLSKGYIGEDNSALLGAMMITKIQLAAMSRVNIPESERRDFYLYIDEFQNFSTESFANILSEARKYHLNLIIAHQYIEQLTDEVRAAVFGNVGTLVSFRVGAADAEELVKEFAPTFTEEDILNLPKFEFYVKLMIDGVASTPFSARGLPPLTQEEKTNNWEKAIAWTRENYAKPVAVVEKVIMDSYYQEELSLSGKDRKEEKHFSPPAPVKMPLVVKKEFLPPVKETRSVAAVAPEFGNINKKENFPAIYNVVCASCGEVAEVPFKPDGSRPVYCKKCLSNIKKEKRDSFKKNESRVYSKPQPRDLSAFSPRALAAAGKVESVGPTLSLSNLSAKPEAGLVKFRGKGNNHKDQEFPPKMSEKELEEGEDIIFE